MTTDRHDPSTYLPTHRLKKIARAAAFAMPPPSVDDVRFLLDVIRTLAVRGNFATFYEAAKCEPAQPRCKLCYGEGCEVCNATT